MTDLDAETLRKIEEHFNNMTDEEILEGIRKRREANPFLGPPGWVPAVVLEVMEECDAEEQARSGDL